MSAAFLNLSIQRGDSYLAWVSRRQPDGTIDAAYFDGAVASIRILDREDVEVLSRELEIEAGRAALRLSPADTAELREGPVNTGYLTREIEDDRTTFLIITIDGMGVP